LAGWSLLAVVLSGSYNVWIQVKTPATMWTTTYGRVLSVKLVFVLALAWLGALCRYTIVRRMMNLRPGSFPARLFRVGRLALFGRKRVSGAPLPSRLIAYVWREAWLGVVVLGCTAVLTDSTPARHAVHVGHQDVSSPAFITMEELHARGGIPPGWILTPPSGDPRRGRAVFAGLACFTCHHVAGETFPPSTLPGPDLTNVGAHHPPGYLLESVLNPDAVIVQAPGYTDPQGRSIMPDFRNRLSVNQLVDLVAYLASLKGYAADTSDTGRR
jgi:mono/diheme cytochrome c family protein